MALTPDRRPAWYLLPGGVIVPANGKAKAAAVYRCREGDDHWTPIGRATATEDEPIPREADRCQPSLF